MIHISKWRSREYLVFLVIVGLVYATIFWATECLQGPLWDDERGFWKTSLTFSHQLVPSIEQLRNYDQLNTPAPFILYGILEYLFKAGPFAARLVNLSLSLIITFLIGWPGKQSNSKPIFAMLGLFLFPYYLWLSTRLYTDMLASFFVLLGVILYLRKHPILSSLSFIAAIACRQFMVSFPAAVATYELYEAIRHRRRPSLSFFLPLFAGLSLIGWIIFFGGLAPSAAFENRMTGLQQTLLATPLANGIFFLSTIGWSYVIPEFLLFRKQVLSQKINIRKLATISIILFPVFLILSQEIRFLGVSFFTNLINTVSPNMLQQLLVSSLALITCWRFSRVNFSFWLIAYNFAIMTQAVAWDKYALPLVIVLWYLRAENARQQTLFIYRSSSRSNSEQRQNNLART